MNSRLTFLDIFSISNWRAISSSLIAGAILSAKIFELISTIEKTIIDTLRFYEIETFADRKNIGVWFKDNSSIKKVGAIGIKVSKWIAYHGFSININNNLEKYKAIIPCGIKDKGITNLKQIKDQDYNKLEKKLVEIFISNLNK